MPSSAFGVELKRWRELRRQSQLDLSLEAGVSQRHVSFIESGKSNPTREMVLRLATALDVPLYDRNVLLNAAGFAPSYLQRGLDEPAMAQIRHVLELLLAAHEPFPAHVVDRHWNLLLANEAMARLIRFLPHSVTDEAGEGGNIVRLTMHPQGLRSVIANWEESAGALLRRLAQDVAYRPEDEFLRTLLAEAAGGVGR